MEFSNSRYLKPIIKGFINEKQTRMLVDTGADYTILNVPKYKLKRDDNGGIVKDANGRFIKEKKVLDAEYDKLIRDNYGSFVKNKDGKFVKTTIHGFGDTSSECRLIILKTFSFDKYEFTDSYVLLDENGFANNHDLILGTSCLRNFRLIIDYDERTIEFDPKYDSVLLRYDGIIGDANIIDGGIILPADIYINDYAIDDIPDLK